MVTWQLVVLQQKQSFQCEIFIIVHSKLKILQEF